jgi:hypothetical protein
MSGRSDARANLFKHLAGVGKRNAADQVHRPLTMFLGHCRSLLACRDFLELQHAQRASWDSHARGFVCIARFQYNIAHRVRL